MSSAIGFKTIELIQKEHLLRNAEEMGNHFLRELHSLKNKFHFIEDVRGLGLMDAIELDTAQRRDKLRERCLKNGLLLLNCGSKSIRFLPPLNVNKREIDLAIEILEKSLKEVRK